MMHNWVIQGNVGLREGGEGEGGERGNWKVKFLVAGDFECRLRALLYSECL